MGRVAELGSLGGMTTRSHFDCPGVALRLFGVSVVCAILFILDRVIPALLGFEFSRFQHATLYLWLLVLPACVLLSYQRIFSVESFSQTARIRPPY